MKLLKMESYNESGDHLNHIVNLNNCLSIQTNSNNHTIDFFNSDGSKLSIPVGGFDEMNQTFEDIWEHWNDDKSLSLEVL